MVVFPMAGLSRRFTDEGYKVPKFQLEISGRPAFDWSLLSFSPLFNKEDFLIICRKSPEVQNFIEDRLRACGINRVQIVALDNPTAGQAETVSLGLEKIDAIESERLIIFNIDTFRTRLNLKYLDGLDDWSGSIEIFRAEGSGWSFVEPINSESKLVRRVTEKIRISDLCSTGLYAFKSVKIFNAAYRAEFLKRSSHELFVAPLYNHIISDGGKVYYNEISSHDVILCGTPIEYMDVLNRGVDLNARFFL